jgi:peroxiredoxin
MKHPFTHYLQRIGLLVVLLMLTIACGTNTSSTTTETNAPASASDSPAANVQEPTAVPVSQDEGTDMLPPAQEDAAKTVESPAQTGKRIALKSNLLDVGNRSAIQRGSPAPNFTYTFADGTKQQLSDLRGKKVMINFWATWCPPCNAEMPDIQKAAELFEDNNFVVLGVSQDLQTELIEPFADQYQITFPLIADPQGQIASRYGARNLPTSVFINTDGTIHTVVMGMVSLEFIQERVEQIQ